MMDLHVDRPGETDETEPFEIFEAGTGAGSLTIQIARALHAANPPLSRALRDAIPSTPLKPQDDTTHQTVNLMALDLPEDLAAEAAAYTSSRRAVLHTLDHKTSHSRLAHSMIRRFRRGMYLSTVDFHTGTSITSYIDSRLAARDGRPFLSRAVLDLPAPEDHAGAVVRALRPNATLVAFSPSISQVAALAAWSTRTGQPLRLDRVAELPNSSSAEYGVLESEGGRAWNVKTVVPKEGAEPVQVMRPRVGDKIAGGGFVAVLRRVADEDGAAQVEEADEDGRE